MRAPLAGLLLPALFWVNPANAMPAAMKAMLDAAIASGDESEIAAIAKFAKQVSPTDAFTIDALVTARRSGLPPPLTSIEIFPEKPSPPLVGALARAPDPPPIPWKGRAEIGGFMATGNSPYIGATAGVNLTREGEYWRHTVLLQGDYQETDGVTTRERLVASWQPRYKFSADGYSYGLVQYEHDPFLGYGSRYTLSGGAGYRVIKNPRLTLDLEAGPALRFTDFSSALVPATSSDDGAETMLAGRGSFTLDWKPRSGISVTQNASIYADTITSTVNGTTALTAKLMGPLSARLSYNIQYESNPPDGRRTTDTLSRASLVYDF